jgi:hypothetical protein
MTHELEDCADLARRIDLQIMEHDQRLMEQPLTPNWPPPSYYTVRMDGLLELYMAGAPADLIIRFFRRHLGSHERAWPLVRVMECADASVFWPVFLNIWTVCDAAWEPQKRLLPLLRERADENFLDWASSCDDTENADDEYDGLDGQKMATFYNGLPDIVEIYRGCSANRVRAISWTTDHETARRFAHGHRGIRVPSPVLAAAKVRKVDIFAVFTAREESEVIIDPRRLRKLVVTPHVKV